jgi:SOS-response transcriptional repressor LexA
MKISDTRLRNFRRILAERKLRLTDIADQLGKAPAQVSAFGGKNPTKGIGDQIAREIENALGLHNGYLDMPFGVGEFDDATILSHTGRRLPVLDAFKASAWCAHKLGVERRTVEEWIDAPGPVGPDAFILRVAGLSMEPKFLEGDKVVIDPALEVLSGHFLVVQQNKSDAAMLRQLKQEGEQLYLLALNPDWPQRITPLTGEWHICGRARWKISDL